MSLIRKNCRQLKGIVQIIVGTRVYGIVFFVQPGVKGRLLSWSTAEREAAAMHQGNIRWQFHIPTGMTQSHFYAERRQTLFLPTSGPQTAQTWTPWISLVWAVMQERVYEKRANDVDELCQRLLSLWHSIGQNIIDEAIDQWRVRLTACVRAKGGHFEHLM